MVKAKKGKSHFFNNSSIKLLKLVSLFLDFQSKTLALQRQARSMEVLTDIDRTTNLTFNNNHTSQLSLPTSQSHTALPFQPSLPSLPSQPTLTSHPSQPVPSAVSANAEFQTTAPAGSAAQLAAPTGSSAQVAVPVSSAVQILISPAVYPSCPTSASNSPPSSPESAPGEEGQVRKRASSMQSLQEHLSVLSKTYKKTFSNRR